MLRGMPRAAAAAKYASQIGKGAAGWLTPVIVAIVAYVFLGLAEVSEEMSHPFGTSPNALPLDAICRAMEISLAPHLGEEPPAPLAPVDYLLG